MIIPPPIRTSWHGCDSLDAAEAVVVGDGPTGATKRRPPAHSALNTVDGWRPRLVAPSQRTSRKEHSYLTKRLLFYREKARNEPDGNQ